MAARPDIKIAGTILGLGLALNQAAAKFEDNFIEPIRQEIEQKVDLQVPPFDTSLLQWAQQTKGSLRLQVNQDLPLGTIRASVNSSDMDDAYTIIDEAQANRTQRQERRDQIVYQEYGKSFFIPENAALLAQGVGWLVALRGAWLLGARGYQRLPRNVRVTLGYMNPFSVDPSNELA